MAEEDSGVGVERSGRPHCSCIGHSAPGIRHAAACCSEPHIDQSVTAADIALTESMRTRSSWGEGRASLMADNA